MKLNKRQKKALIATILSALFTSTSYAATISSTFDTDDEGWIIQGDATSSLPAYQATGGNPGGHIEADDRITGGVWYFSAPDKFLGDISSAYNQTLDFDLKQTGSGSQFNAKDVILNGAGLELSIDAGPNPLPVGDWVSYSVLFNESAGWLNGGIAATQSELQTVLGSLTQLRIRGEFIAGADTGRLDNVVVNTVPVPAAVWLFGSGLIGLLSVSRRRT